MKDEELKSDNTKELIDAVKEGLFAIRRLGQRVVDAEAQSERYRLALVECLHIADNWAVFGDSASRHMHGIISEALK